MEPEPIEPEPVEPEPESEPEPEILELEIIEPVDINYETYFRLDYNSRKAFMKKYNLNLNNTEFQNNQKIIVENVGGQIFSDLILYKSIILHNSLDNDDPYNEVCSFSNTDINLNPNLNYKIIFVNKKINLIPTISPEIYGAFSNNWLNHWSILYFENYFRNYDYTQININNSEDFCLGGSNDLSSIGNIYDNYSNILGGFSSLKIYSNIIDNTVLDTLQLEF